MSLDLDAIRERARRAHILLGSGIEYRMPAEAAVIVRHDVLDLLVEIERLNARIDAAHEALAIDEFDDDSCNTLEETITYAVHHYRLVRDSEAQAADEIRRLKAEVAR